MFFSSYLILVGLVPAPTLPPEAATFCSMDYPPTAPMSTEVCPRPPHSGMVSQETTSRCYVLYMEGGEEGGLSYRNVGGSEHQPQLEPQKEG